MKTIFLFISLCLLYSCFTPRQKLQYLTKHMIKLQKKYNVPQDFSFDFNPADSKLLSHKKLKKQKKFEIDNGLKYSEKIFALIPDSFFIKKNKEVDSFYTNENKIKYITTNDLKTNNIFFVKKEH